MVNSHGKLIANVVRGSVSGKNLEKKTSYILHDYDAFSTYWNEEDETKRCDMGSYNAEIPTRPHSDSPESTRELDRSVHPQSGQISLSFFEQIDRLLLFWLFWVILVHPRLCQLDKSGVIAVVDSYPH